MVKHVFVTVGVVSSPGYGTAAEPLDRPPEARGLQLATEDRSYRQTGLYGHPIRITKSIDRPKVPPCRFHSRARSRPSRPYLLFGGRVEVTLHQGGRRLNGRRLTAHETKGPCT